MYLFLAVLGLRCGMGFSLVAVQASRCRAQPLGTRLAAVTARVLSDGGSWAPGHRLSSCGARA